MNLDDELLYQSLADTFGISRDDTDILEGLRADLSIEGIGAGDTLVSEGEPSDALFILLQGRLYASAEGPGGEVFLGEIRRGETIGEIGIIMDAPRGATVRAARASTVARLSAEAFHDLMGRYPALGLAIARTLITRSSRDAGPRHPGFVPETMCLMRATPGADPERVAKALSAESPLPVRIIPEGGDLAAARMAVHDGERRGERVIILASGADPDWLRMAVSEADEVVRVADAGDAPLPGDAEREIARDAGAVLPRHTLLLVHPDDTRSPLGTRNWLEPRQVDRHLHMRMGVAADVGRVGRLLSGRAVGIVFAGGAARGGSHVGAIRALNEAGVEFDIVGGTSIGAAMAAWYAMGLRGDDLQRAACKVFVDSGGPTSDWNLVPLLSLVKGKQTRDLCIESIRETTGHDIDIEDTWTPYFCMTANYTAQEQAVLQRGPLWQALSATYAIPGVLPPVIIEGELHVDGGVMNNLPVDVLEEVGAAYTIAIDLLGERKKAIALKEMPTTLPFLIDRFRPRKKRKYRIPGILSMLFNSTVLASLKLQREMALRAHLCMTPDLPRVGLLDWGKFNETIELGYQSIRDQLPSVPEEVMAALRGRAG